MKENLLEVKNLTLHYNTKTTAGISNINFAIKRGECLSLIGPSGSGKTTTLKIIGDQIHNYRGEVKSIGAYKVAYVPQMTELPDGLTVFEILENEIKKEIPDIEKRTNQVRSAIALLNITNEINSKSSEISGGQRQRVIIAKALVKNPSLILLDEPFGHLDEKLRFTLIQELFLIFKEKEISVLWVTHETHESLSFSDRIVLLNHGKVQQIDTPENIYQKPTNMFVAQFFGQTNLVAGKIISYAKDELIVKALKKEFIVHRPQNFKETNHGDTLLVIRPESIKIEEDGDYLGTILDILFQGAHYLLQIKDSSGHTLWAQVSSFEKYAVKQKVRFNIIYKNLYSLDEI